MRSMAEIEYMLKALEQFEKDNPKLRAEVTLWLDGEGSIRIETRQMEYVDGIDYTEVAHLPTVVDRLLERVKQSA